MLATHAHASNAEDWTTDDLALMQQFARGDRAAGRTVSRRLLPRIKRVVRTIAGNAVDGEDIVQVVLVEVLRSARSYRGESALETWAQRITVRHTLKVLRARNRRAEQLDAAVDAEEVAQEEAAARRLAEALPRPLQEYLDEMDDLHRETVVLRYGLGYSIQEIAELSGAKANTVKVRLYNGLKKLRANVERDLAAEGRAR